MKETFVYRMQPLYLPSIAHALAILCRPFTLLVVNLILSSDLVPTVSGQPQQVLKMMVDNQDYMPTFEDVERSRAPQA